LDRFSQGEQMRVNNNIELDGKVFGCGVWVKNWEVVFESQKDEIEEIIQTFKKIIENNNLEKTK